MVALILILLAAGCWSGKASESNNNKARVLGESDRTEVVLYFCDRDGHLVVEFRELAEGDNLPEAVLRELIRGPETNELLPTVPEGTTLNGVVVKDGLARADFSPELKTNHWGGSLGETITVYSIINTLAQFPEVKRVQILIDGQEVDTLSGHLDLSEPLTPNLELVKK
jgi:spore germination protein GerM